jgi:hypothetical protein
VGDYRYDLKEGDGVLFEGAKTPHWRNVCDGPQGYYSGHLLIHFVRAEGKYSTLANARWSEKHPFVKNRTILMLSK